MRRISRREGYGSMAELNVTPLLDLAFTLLIIFVITTPFLEQSVELTPPSAAPRHPAEPGAIQVISVNAAGALFLEGKPIPSLAAMRTELAALAARTPEIAIGIRADRALPYERIVRVIETLEQAGIQRFGLITRVDE